MKYPEKRLWNNGMMEWGNGGMMDYWDTGTMVNRRD